MEKCYEQYGQIQPTTAGYWDCMCDMLRDATWLGRVGNHIKVPRIFVRCSVHWQNTHVTPNVVRLMCFVDTQPNGAFPTLAQMFRVTTAPFTCYVQPIQWLYRERFIPLWDKTASCAANYGGTALGNDAYTLWEYDESVDIDVTYKGNAGAVSDLSTNAIHLFMITEDASGVELPYVEYWTRVLYTD